MLRSNNSKKIIDVCCGSKMFWLNKENPNVMFCDNRQLDDTLCDGRKLHIKPDVVADFTHLPFEDKSFKLCIFDPPHLKSIGTNSWLAKKYGRLDENWASMIKQGFDECMRILENNGVLIFKWNETDITVKQILDVIGYQPLFGHKSGRLNKTHWMCFMKLEGAA